MATKSKKSMNSLNKQKMDGRKVKGGASITSDVPTSLDATPIEPRKPIPTEPDFLLKPIALTTPK